MGSNLNRKGKEPEKEPENPRSGASASGASANFRIILNDEEKVLYEADLTELVNQQRLERRGSTSEASTSGASRSEASTSGASTSGASASGASASGASASGASTNEASTSGINREKGVLQRELGLKYEKALQQSLKEFKDAYNQVYNQVVVVLQNSKVLDAFQRLPQDIKNLIKQSRQGIVSKNKDIQKERQQQFDQTNETLANINKLLSNIVQQQLTDSNRLNVNSQFQNAIQQLQQKLRTIQDICTRIRELNDAINALNRS